MTFILSTSSEVCATLGARLRQLRLSQNFTQTELAARAGVSFGAVRKLESSGQTTLATFVKCVQALGAAGDLEAVLTLPARSIAQLEISSQAVRRLRARKPSGQRAR
jgi:transcriptional regulator with XRE-family HTH domain